MVFWLLSLWASFSAFASRFTRFVHVTLYSKVWWEVILHLGSGMFGHFPSLCSWRTFPELPGPTSFLGPAPKDSFLTSDKRIKNGQLVCPLSYLQSENCYKWAHVLPFMRKPFLPVIASAEKCQSAPCHLGLVSWHTYFMWFLALKLTE